MCVPDISVLRSAILGDKQYNLGAIVAHRLHNNSIHGDFFDGIYATRIANFLEIPIRGDDISYAGCIDSTKEISINSVIMQPTCNNGPPSYIVYLLIQHS